MTALEQAVFDAALELIDTKREADPIFRDVGLPGMPELLKFNPLARQLADRVNDAGIRLAKAVDEYRKCS